jgi:hypothetical protein
MRLSLIDHREKTMPEVSPAALTALPDEALLEELQKKTFRFFWDGAEPVSGLARDRNRQGGDTADNLVAVGGSGFGLLALVVAAARGWVSRIAAVTRLSGMLDALELATRYHGVYPHFLDGVSGVTIPFGPLDDGGDLVETSFLMMGLLTARRYFDRPEEADLGARITALWEAVEWVWHVQPGQKVLTWHWSQQHGFKINHAIRGWNECLITYVLAAASPTYPIAPEIYLEGFCAGADYRNGNSTHGILLPLGPPLGGPLFFAHYSFCGLDPHGLSDTHADYWVQNVAQTRINQAHCIANPGGFSGYSAECWGLTASDDPSGYEAHAPDNDNGTLSPTAALSSLVYAPNEAMKALRHFLAVYGDRIWGRYGFTDAFNPTRNWYADTFLAIDQGPIIVMIENYRSGLLWKLFMSVPEVRYGLSRLGFRFSYDGA